MPGIASSSPAVLRRPRRATATLRLGSGGVMLPNHAPLAVAEQFGMLEALHPGRIDLGIGRAPGTDGRRPPPCGAPPTPADDFPRELAELLGYFKRRVPRGPPLPTSTPRPAWATAGDLAARLQRYTRSSPACSACRSRSPTTSPRNTMPALELYRRSSGRPRPREPYAMVGVRGVCADAEERAAPLRARRACRWPACAPGARRASRRRRRPRRTSSPRRGQSVSVLARRRRRPGDGAGALDELAERTAADELMITTMVHDHADRIRSYELIADDYDLAAPGAAATATMEDG